jgi:GNAT superfamily N-acetyltransferase
VSDEEQPDVLTPDAGLVRRAQSIYGDYTASRVRIVAERPGNPLAAEVRRFGSAVACRAPVFGEHLFNRAFGFTDEYLDGALEVISWYEEAGVAGAFEIAPGLPNDKLLALLHAHGLRHTGFHAMFAGRVREATDPPEGVDVLRLEGTGHIEAFSDAYHRGWNFDVRVPVEPWLHAPGWSLYLGLCDGIPAGAGVLYLSGGDAYLADAAVDPSYRRRGVHRALLERRSAEAAAAGATVVFSGAAFLSASHRNMLRNGLSLAFTKALWTLTGA